MRQSVRNDTTPSSTAKHARSASRQHDRLIFEARGIVGCFLNGCRGDCDDSHMIEEELLWSGSYSQVCKFEEYGRLSRRLSQPQPGLQLTAQGCCTRLPWERA